MEDFLSLMARLMRDDAEQFRQAGVAPADVAHVERSAECYEAVAALARGEIGMVELRSRLA